MPRLRISAAHPAFLVLPLTLALGAPLTVLAQDAPSSPPPGIQRELLTRQDLSLPGREAVVARVTVAPGVTAGRHSHFGEEISVVLEGEGELLIDGEPPRQLKAGDAFVIPAGKVHDARNTGTVPMQVIGTFVVEKGKPLATPAAAKEK